MENSGLMTTKIVQLFFKINSIIHFKNTEQKLMKIFFLSKLGITQTLLQTFDEIYQNTKIITIIYSN